MSTDMVERVARAIAGSGLAVRENWEECVFQAWAAISAMREPTEAMVKFGTDHIGMVLDFEDAEEAARLAWPAMIDAALEERE